MTINLQSILHTLPTGDEKLNHLNMLVEIPRGSINKFEYKVDTGLIHLDRVLYQQTPYPVEYGLIPQTWDEDEDMLDIMCLTSYPTFPGCVLSARPIGVMYFVDAGQVDDKIISVPAGDVRYKHIMDIRDLSDHTKEEIDFFFTHYKKIQLKYKHGKKIPKNAEPIIKHWGNRDHALRVIQKAMTRYKQKFAK